MVSCPYAIEIEKHHRNEARNSYVRLLHALPELAPVDIYANNKRLVRNFTYKEFSEYLLFLPGSYEIKVFPAGKRINPIVATTINVVPGVIMTLGVIGMVPSIGLYPIIEPPVPHIPTRSCIRFIHLVPGAPAVDLTRLDGKIIFRNVKYKDITDYVCVSSGRFGLDIRLAGTNKAILTDPTILLLPNKHYSIYLVGTVAGTEPLQILIALDGSSYIQR